MESPHPITLRQVQAIALATLGNVEVLHPVPAEKARAAIIIPLAILEAAALLCGIAFLLTPTFWPLIASAIPLGTMLAWFPRGG